MTTELASATKEDLALFEESALNMQCPQDLTLYNSNGESNVQITFQNLNFIVMGAKNTTFEIREFNFKHQLIVTILISYIFLNS